MGHSLPACGFRTAGFLAGDVDPRRQCARGGYLGGRQGSPFKRVVRFLAAAPCAIRAATVFLSAEAAAGLATGNGTSERAPPVDAGLRLGIWNALVRSSTGTRVETARISGDAIHAASTPRHSGGPCQWMIRSHPCPLRTRGRS